MRRLLPLVAGDGAGKTIATGRDRVVAIAGLNGVKPGRVASAAASALPK